MKLEDVVVVKASLLIYLSEREDNVTWYNINSCLFFSVVSMMKETGDMLLCLMGFVALFGQFRHSDFGHYCFWFARQSDWLLPIDELLLHFARAK